MKALKIVGGIVALVVIGLVIFVLTFDIGKYKGTIEEQAKAATGREVKIGSISMGISLTPTILVKDVTVANAPWGSRPQMVIMKSLSAKAQLIPLLSGKVDITKIDLDGADVLLETNKDGKHNWDFEPEGAKSNAPATAQPQQQQELNVGGIDVSDMKIAMKDAQKNSDMDMAVKSAALRLDGPLQQMNVTHIAINDASMNQRMGQDTTTASIGKIDIDSAGPLASLGFKKIDVSSVKVVGKSADAPLDAEISKVSLDDKGAFELDAKYNGGDISAKGTLDVAGIKKGDKAVAMKLALEGMGLKGDVDLVVNAAAQPPSAKGSVHIPEIDLAKLGAPASAPAPAKPAAAPAKPAAAPAKPAAAPAPAPAPAPAAGGMFSNDPLPWDALHSADADVKLTIDTLKLPNGQAITKVSLPIKLAKGHLELDNASLDMLGGTITGDVDANAATKAVAIKGNVKGLSAETIAKAYKVTDLVTNGPLDAAIDLHGAGASPKAIAGTLSGSMLVGMGESKIRTEAIGKVGAQIIAAINPMGNKDPYTVARCAVTNFQITNGVANTQNGVAMVTDKMSLTASGKIDLLHEQIDMSVKPLANSVIGSGLTKFVSQINVKGPLASPNIGIDAASTAKSVATMAAGAASGAGLLGAVGGALGGNKLFGGNKAQAAPETKTADASPSGDICAAARAWGHK